MNNEEQVSLLAKIIRNSAFLIAGSVLICGAVVGGAIYSSGNSSGFASILPFMAVGAYFFIRAYSNMR
jgi:hypothetical protein